MIKLITYPVILSLLFICFFPIETFPAETLSRENPVVLAVRKVSPAVVNISSTQLVKERFSPFSPFSGDSFFEEFFRDFFEPSYRRRYAQTSLGSGVIVDGTEGFILTNQHVIEGTSQIIARLADNREFKAQVVGSDPDSDLAVLKIDAESKLPCIEMGDSDDIMIGESVIAIGNPFGFSHTVTTGVVSALNRSLKTEKQIYNELIQTDAAINPGNSGGPLLNINGDLIGINTAIYYKAQGIGFAIPINKAKRILDDLIRYGEVHSAWIGVEVQDTEDGGALIFEVTANSPADKSGLSIGDRIIVFNKMPIKSAMEFEHRLRDFTAGDTIDLTYIRDEETRQTTLRTGDFPLYLVGDWVYRRVGIRVTEGQGKGVVISKVRPRSYVQSIGLREGDVISHINDMDVRNVEDFNKAIVKYRRSGAITLLVVRGHLGYYITLKL